MSKTALSRFVIAMAQRVEDTLYHRVIHILESKRMLRIGRMRLARDNAPLRDVEWRKERIGSINRRIDEGQMHARGERQRKRIDLATADHA